MSSVSPYSVGKTLSQDTLDLCSILSCPQIYTKLHEFLNMMICSGMLVLPEAFLVSCASAICEGWDGSSIGEYGGGAVLHGRVV